MSTNTDLFNTREPRPRKPTITIIEGDAQIVAAELAAAGDRFHASLSDPPYGLSFMSKGWDRKVPGPDLWREVLKTLHPGAHVIAFGGTRTWHHLALALEDAGAEMRDTLMWLYGQGFPKNHNVPNALGALEEHDLAERHAGHGTALKPAWEPALLFRKPLEQTIARTARDHNTSTLAIDASRIEVEALTENAQGRWPANIILDAEAGAVLDAQSGVSTSSSHIRRTSVKPMTHSKGADSTHQTRGVEDTGGASRFFYCAKASRREKEAGLEDFEAGRVNDGRSTIIDNAYQRGDTKRRNPHPTVKPLDLIRYLAGLLLPPEHPEGAELYPRKIIVPFSGSGSEVIACAQAGWDHVVGIELNPEYAEISRARIAHWIEASDLPHELL